MIQWSHNNGPYPPSYNDQQQHQQPYANQRQSAFIPQTQPQAYTQAPCQTAPTSDPILEAVSQLMEQMTRMNSRVDKIQDFVKTDIQPTTDKKGEQVTFTDQLPSQATANPRNQGARRINDTSNIEPSKWKRPTGSIQGSFNPPRPDRRRNTNYHRARQQFGG